MTAPRTAPGNLAAHAGQVLQAASIAELPNRYRGKVRENYDLPGRTAGG